MQATTCCGKDLTLVSIQVVNNVFQQIQDHLGVPIRALTTILKQ